MRKLIVYLLLALFIITPLVNVLAYGTNYQYTGQEKDVNSNLYYYGQRYYQPEVGRFTQVDPLQNFLVTPELTKRTGLTLEQALSNPQRLNSYSYSLNNPVNVIDPTGESPVVSEERQTRFNKLNDYIINDQDYHNILNNQGNKEALDLLWQKALEITDNDVGIALEVFFDSINIDRAHDKTLDESDEQYSQRLTNLPNGLDGQYDSSVFGNTDKLQHFVKSAMIAYWHNKNVSKILGYLHEVKDELLSHVPSFSNKSYYHPEGYSKEDMDVNQSGINFGNELKNNQETMPSQY